MHRTAVRPPADGCRHPGSLPGPCPCRRRARCTSDRRANRPSAFRSGQRPARAHAPSRPWSCQLRAAPAIDTQSDTLRSARPRDSWTPSEAKVREFLSKTHRRTLLDAGGSAEINLLIRVSLVRSQRGPQIESITYEDTGHGICLTRVQIGSTLHRHSPSAVRRTASTGPPSDCANLRSAGTATTRVSAVPAATIPRRTTTQGSDVLCDRIA